MSQAPRITPSNRRRHLNALRLTIALAAAATWVPGTAQALPPEPPEPLLVAHDVQGGGWSSYRIAVEANSTVNLRILGKTGHYTMNAVGMWIFTGTGELVSSITATGYIVLVDETYFSVSALGVDEYARSGTRSGDEMSITVNRTSLPAGEYSVVMGAVSDEPLQRRVSRIYGDEGVTVLSQAHGSAAFMNYEPDFDSTANVLASKGVRAGTYGNGVRAGAMIEGSASETVRNRLFGQFRSTHRATLISVDSPSGATEPWLDPHFFNASEPGEYTFNVQATGGVSPPYSGAVWAWGLDAPLL